jgi:hypothetical protein
MTVWQRFKNNPPKGPIPFKDLIKTIEHLSKGQARCYNYLFKKLAENIEQADSIKVKRPFSEIGYEQAQATAAAKLQAQLDNSLIAIWPKIQDQLNVPVPPASAEEIKSWLNNPENKTELDRITDLDLGRLGLEILPPEIGNLKLLQNLQLPHNHLVSLPEAIGNLSSLEWLFLGDNRLLSLPDTIGNLSLLEGLYLDDNRLVSLPEAIGNLSSLEHLVLTGNHLVLLPAALEDLSSLQWLNLDRNQLTFIPDNILKSSRDVLLTNETIKRFKKELSFASSSPLAKLYQAIMRRTDVEETKRAFHHLSYEDQCLIFEKIFHLSGDPQTEDLQWGEHHLFDNMDIFYRSVREVVISKYEGLDPETKRTVEDEIYRLAGFRSTNDGQWGKAHALENLPHLADAVSKVALQSERAK